MSVPTRYRDVMTGRPLSQELGIPDTYVDPDAPALPAPDPSLHQTMIEIRDAIRALPQDAPAKMNEILFRLPDIASEANVRAPFEFTYLFVSPVPRPTRVYAGLGKSLFLAMLTTNQSLRVKLPIPFRDIYIDWDAGTADQRLHFMFSTADMDIRIQ